YAVLFNRSASSQSINGWSVQYASAAGTTWTVLSLPNATLSPGQYFCVKMASGGAVGAVFAADYTNTVINASATAGKFALVNSTTALSGSNPVGGATIVDFIGFGATASGFEGTGPTPAPSATVCVRRGGGGCTD